MRRIGDDDDDPWSASPLWLWCAPTGIVQKWMRLGIIAGSLWMAVEVGGVDELMKTVRAVQADLAMVASRVKAINAMSCGIGDGKNDSVGKNTVADCAIALPGRK